jgi:myo-inositol-1(or 4)-monophosphatase
VAEGAYDAMLTFRPSWEWDIAAGLLICARAGAMVRDARGRDIRFNTDQARAAGVVAAAPGLMAPLLARLAG